jgi:hypothetical protein
MLLYENDLSIPVLKGHAGLLPHISSFVLNELRGDEIPIRLAVTKTESSEYACELGVLEPEGEGGLPPRDTIFQFRKRNYENTDQFNAVLCIPTGVGAVLGGHSGDGGALSRLIAGACDKLITHPNVVNAADINELPENGLYVEGSVISRLLMGSVALQETRLNRLLMILDEHEESFIHELSINAVSAARAALGIECSTVKMMRDRAIMRAFYTHSGRAAGQIEHFERLCRVIEDNRADIDAVAVSSLINVPTHYHSDYFKKSAAEMVNPWGGVEAMLTHALSLIYDIPTAHSPMMTSKEIMDLDVGIVDPRKSAEAISNTYLHCILKGLRNSPAIIKNDTGNGLSGLINVTDVSCLIIPDGCVGLPTLAALEQGIPVIAVRENKNCMQNSLEDLPFESGKLFIVDNYLEAVGVMTAIRSGVSLGSVRRPIAETKVEYFRQPSEAIKVQLDIEAERPDNSHL